VLLDPEPFCHRELRLNLFINSDIEKDKTSRDKAKSTA